MKYTLELLEEETGERICEVDINEEQLDFIIQRGFIEIMKECLTPK